MHMADSPSFVLVHNSALLGTKSTQILATLMNTIHVLHACMCVCMCVCVCVRALSSPAIYARTSAEPEYYSSVLRFVLKLFSDWLWFVS